MLRVCSRVRLDGLPGTRRHRPRRNRRSPEMLVNAAAQVLGPLAVDPVPWARSHMAFTFAVGAVTGTVLSFEFGLLWPRFMGQWGEAFGVPFGFEGIFFFTEAIFVAIYIFGWRRMRPWAHFWTGVPIVLAGIFGAVSVVAANAWMNSPSGFTLNSSGEVVSVDPLAVIFNDAMPLMAAHMVIAAYV